MLFFIGGCSRVPWYIAGEEFPCVVTVSQLKGRILANRSGERGPWYFDKVVLFIGAYNILGVVLKSKEVIFFSNGAFAIGMQG